MNNFACAFTLRDFKASAASSQGERFWKRIPRLKDTSSALGGVETRSFPIGGRDQIGPYRR